MKLLRNLHTINMNKWVTLSTAVLVTIVLASCSLSSISSSTDAVKPHLSVMGLQADVDEVTINITGQNYKDSLTVSPSSGPVELILPPSKDVKFEVEASNQDSATDHIYTWGMTRYADLVQGEAAELDFVMGPKETKVFIPDYLGNQGRVIQLSSLDVTENISDLGAEEWLVTETNNGIGQPFDIELDNQGRIWISYLSYWAISDSSPLIMRENMTDAEPAYEPGVIAASLAFDSLNSMMYFFAYDTQNEQFLLTRLNISKNTNNITFPPDNSDIFDPSLESEINFINEFGLAVDQEGYLYFAGSDGAETVSIYKYDPSRAQGNRVVAQVASEKLGYSAIDLLVKNNHLYATNSGGQDGELILKFTKNLELVDSFGVSSDGTLDEVGEFLQPARFLSTTSDSIYVTDDNPDQQNSNRIIKFDDTDGSGWKSYNPITLDNIDALTLFFGGT